LLFKKARVILLELTPRLNSSYRFGVPEIVLMHTLNLINARRGTETLRFAVVGLQQPWLMRKSLTAFLLN
jgi:Domain of unknown function (DUF4113)